MLIWIKEYSDTNFKGTQGFSIKKYISNCPWQPIMYDISVSPKRKSWYRNFTNLNAAKKFAKSGSC